MGMVEFGDYFIINRPRQYGKTTTLRLIFETTEIMEAYIPIEINFQGVDQQWHETDGKFATMFLKQIGRALKYRYPDLSIFITEELSKVHDMDLLSEVITGLVHKAGKKLILLIDEVDASSNFDPFLSFLGMLRNKYLQRERPENATFHSIVLAGVHDVKTLKSKIRTGEKSELNSPWNIATDFKVDMGFSPSEIAPMLEDYAKEEQVKMDITALSEKLYYYTSGYPFLISKLCKTIAEEILPFKEEKTWTLADVEKAVNLLLQETNTNFDTLIKNLENDQELYDFVFSILMEGAHFNFNVHSPLIFMGFQYGIFSNRSGVRIHNRIYEQLIYNYMSSKMEISLVRTDKGNRLEVIKPDKQLDIELLLLKFQQFMKEQYREKDEAFLEREGRLIFLSFLQPILNGGGYTFVEPQISEEKRLDIVVTYYQYKKYIIELKRWYGPKKHLAGLDQLSDYLERQNCDKGYLLIFEHRTKKTWQKKPIQHSGKEIFAVWV